MSRTTLALSELLQQAVSLKGHESLDWPALRFLQGLLGQPAVFTWLHETEWIHFEYEKALHAAADSAELHEDMDSLHPEATSCGYDFPLDPQLDQQIYLPSVHGAAVHLQAVATDLHNGTVHGATETVHAVQSVTATVLAAAAHGATGLTHSAPGTVHGAGESGLGYTSPVACADAADTDAASAVADAGDTAAAGADAAAPYLASTTDAAADAAAADAAATGASTGTSTTGASSGSGTTTGVLGRGSRSSRRGAKKRASDDEDYTPGSERKARGRPAKRKPGGDEPEPASRRAEKKRKGMKKSGVPANAENVGDGELAAAEEEEEAMEVEEDTPDFSHNTLAGRPDDAIAALSQISNPSCLVEVDRLIKLLASQSETHSWIDPLQSGEDNTLRRLLSVYQSGVRTSAEGYRARFEGMLCDIAFAVGTSRVKHLTAKEKEILASNGDLFIDGEDPYASVRHYKTFDTLYETLFDQDMALSDQVIDEDLRRKKLVTFIVQCKAMRTRGLKWAHMAMAGSLQLLLFIAVVKHTTLFQDVVRDDYTKLGHILRDPHLFQGSPTAMNRVLWQIIPGVLELGRSVNIHFDGRTFGKDLASDDKYWGRELVFNTFALPPRCPEWDGAWLWPTTQTTLLQGPVTIRRPLSPVWEVSSVPTRTIDTVFDLSDPEHERPTFARGDEEGETKLEWTQKRREFIGQERDAGQAVICRTFDELVLALHDAYKDGSVYKGPHIHIMSSVAKGFDVLIRDKHKRIMLYIVDEDALEKYSRIVYNNCRAIVPDGEVFDASNFYAMHYSITNAYCKSGKNYPRKLRSVYQIPDKSNQRIPHPNAELMHDVFTSDIVASCLAPVFALLTERIRTNLPDVYAKLIEYEECLPLGVMSPASPFAGFVVNIAPATIVHRDRDLSDLCMDYTYGDFTGGELVLHQARLVVQFKAGTGGGFASYGFDHFNLDYVGDRGSTVFHTERCGNAWYLHRNDWMPNLM